MQGLGREMLNTIDNSIGNPIFFPSKSGAVHVSPPTITGGPQRYQFTFLVGNWKTGPTLASMISNVFATTLGCREHALMTLNSLTSRVNHVLGSSSERICPKWFCFRKKDRHDTHLTNAIYIQPVKTSHEWDIFVYTSGFICSNISW